MNQTSTVTDPVADDAFCRDLCGQLGMALIAADADLRITLWNAAASKMFGASGEQMLGSAILSVFPAERRPAAERLIRRIIEKGESSDFEFDARDTAGQHREYAAAIAPVVTRVGENCGVSLCVRDITRRLALQADLAESRKMAALGEMAGAIAHHFNNVLGGVVTGIDYAGQSEDPAVTRKVLDQVGRALVRTTALVNGLLVFAEGGHREDDLCDLTELLNQLADEIETSLAGRNVRFIPPEPNLPVTPVARSHLLIVLRNIVQNALEAMPEGGVLGLQAKCVGNAIVISVSDTGHGLDESVISRMFEPFWTTKGSHATSGGPAAGLGLAVAHGIIQRLGGTIRVHSVVGQGTTLELTIPRMNEDLPGDDRKS